MFPAYIRSERTEAESKDSTYSWRVLFILNERPKWFSEAEITLFVYLSTIWEDLFMTHLRSNTFTRTQINVQENKIYFLLIYFHLHSKYASQLSNGMRFFLLFFLLFCSIYKIFCWSFIPLHTGRGVSFATHIKINAQP